MCFYDYYVSYVVKYLISLIDLFNNDLVCNETIAADLVNDMVIIFTAADLYFQINVLDFVGIDHVFFIQHIPTNYFPV